MDKSPNIAGKSGLFCTATTVPAELELLGPDTLWDSWARLWALTDLLLGVCMGHMGISDMEEDFTGDLEDAISNLSVSCFCSFPSF